METNNAITMAAGHLVSRVRVIVAILLVVGRWIGRCKGCGATAKVDGRVARADGPEVAVVAVDGTVYSTRVIGDASLILKQCACARYVLLRKVTEGNKNSKHTCGARCTSSTGPNCDCRCKGANHGSNC
jgi:hypothetical protein